MIQNITATPGMVVDVEVRNRTAKDPNLFDIPETVRYTGTVQPSMSYDPHGTIRISGSGEMPVRVIAKRHIVSWQGTRVSIAAVKQAPTRTFEVKGSKGNTYVVTLDPAGKASCQCTGYTMRRRCSHIDGVLQKIEKE